MYDVTKDKDVKPNTVAALVQGHELAGAIESDNYKEMVLWTLTKSLKSREELYEAMRPEEEEILQKMYDEGDTSVKTKRGKFKITKVCKNSTYSSNKSTIGGALDMGINLFDENGKPVPKSVIIKALSGGKTSTKSNYEKYLAAVSNAARYASKLDNSEIAHAKIAVDGIVSYLNSRD